MTDFTPDDQSQFWEDFRVHHWEREPGVFRFTQGQEPLTNDSVFAAVTHLIEGGHPGRFWATRQPVVTRPRDFTQLDLHLLGPQASDQGFDHFFERMSAYSIGINIHDLEKADDRYSSLIATFADELDAVPNAPRPQRWNSDTFFGTYQATPFGIHRDPAGVFSFLLQGHRRYCFWPPEAFTTGHPDLTRPDPAVLAAHMDDAEIFEAGPGDLVYWPSNRWHVVTSDGEPFVAAQVSAWFDAADVGQA